MSYVLHVWEGPKPLDLDDIPQILDLLNELSCIPNPKFLRFADALMAGYPDDGASVWTDGVVKGLSYTPVFALGVATPTPALLEFVAQTAGAAGLNVHDMQTGRSWFAAQSACPPDGTAASAPQAAPEKLSRRELVRELNLALHALLGDAGFTPRAHGAELVRDIAGGTQSTFIDAEERDGAWEVALGFRIDFQVVGDIWYRLFDKEDPATRRARVSDGFRLAPLPGKERLRIVTAEDARAGVASLRGTLRDAALRRLDGAVNLRAWADRYLSAEARTWDAMPDMMAEHVLVAARLTRHPAFGAFTRHQALARKDGSAAQRERIARLLKYLQHVDPDNVVLPPLAHPCPYPPVDLQPGERVRHPQHGPGVVRQVTGEAFGTRIDVEFDSGKRGAFTIEGWQALQFLDAA